MFGSTHNESRVVNSAEETIVIPHLQVNWKKKEKTTTVCDDRENKEMRIRVSE